MQQNELLLIIHYNNMLVENFIFQPGPGVVGTLLPIAEVGVLPLPLSFPQPLGAQVFSHRRLDVLHQLHILPV